MRLVLLTDDGRIIEEWTELECYDLNNHRSQVELSQGIQQAIIRFHHNPTLKQERR